MNKLLFLICLVVTFSCSKGGDSDSRNNNNNPPPTDPPANSCGTVNGYILHKDAQGCYYSDGYGGKVYVDANQCTC